MSFDQHFGEMGDIQTKRLTASILSDFVGSQVLVCIDHLAADLDYCWMVGTSRLTPNGFECRAFPRSQDDKRRGSVIIESGKTIREALANCIKRLKEI